MHPTPSVLFFLLSHFFYIQPPGSPRNYKGMGCPMQRGLKTYRPVNNTPAQTRSHDQRLGRLYLSPVCNPYCKQVQVQEPLKLDVWTFCPHVYSVHHPSHTHNSKFTSRRSKTLTSTLLLDPTSCLAMVARWAHLRTAFMKMNGKLLSFPSLISILDAYVSILKDE